MIITLASMKDYLGIDSTDTTNDDTIETMIDACQEIFENELNRELEEQTYTAYIDGTGTKSIYVPVYPITSITSLYVDADRNFGSDTLISSSDYVFYPKTGEVTMVEGEYPVRYSYFAKGRQNVKITYVGGYTFSGTNITLPKDIIKAIKDQVKFMFKKWQSGTEGLVSYNTINNSANLVEATDILPMVSRVLDKYRNYYHA